MVIFHSCVSLPEGMYDICMIISCDTLILLYLGFSRLAYLKIGQAATLKKRKATGVAWGSKFGWSISHSPGTVLSQGLETWWQPTSVDLTWLALDQIGSHIFFRASDVAEILRYSSYFHATPHWCVSIWVDHVLWGKVHSGKAFTLFSRVWGCGIRQWHSKHDGKPFFWGYGLQHSHFQNFIWKDILQYTHTHTYIYIYICYIAT